MANARDVKRCAFSIAAAGVARVSVPADALRGEGRRGSVAQRWSEDVERHRNQRVIAQIANQVATLHRPKRATAASKVASLTRLVKSSGHPENRSRERC